MLGFSTRGVGHTGLNKTHSFTFVKEVMAMKVVTAEQMREIDRQAAASGIPTEILMQNAGRAVAGRTIEWLGGVAGKEVLVLVGPGNNGGDGLVAASHLHDEGARVTMYIWGRTLDTDANYRATQGRGIPAIQAEKDTGFCELARLASKTDVLVDSLLGTGKAREIAGTLKALLDTVSGCLHPRARVVAVDLPTGINADTGAVDPATIPADLTITLGFPKPGLFLPPALDYVAKLVVADIGFPPEPEGQSALEMTTPAMIRQWLPKRTLSSHKGTYGKVLVIAGSINYTGAPCLACLGAGRVGAGLVTLAPPATIHPIVAGKLTETTFLPLPDSSPGFLVSEAVAVVAREIPAYDAVLVGPGLGQNSLTVQFVESLLKWAKGSSSTFTETPRWVVDADGLNVLVQIPHWPELLPNGTVLTPHPAELSRLIGASVGAIQADRIGCARAAASQWGCIVVLKGANTLIAMPDGQVFINPSANPALATAGTGDVLSGAIAGLAAQGVEPRWAAVSAVYLHAAAGEAVRETIGDAGTLASDLLPHLPRALQRVKGN